LKPPGWDEERSSSAEHRSPGATNPTPSALSGEAGLKPLGGDENVLKRGAQVAWGDQSHPLRDSYFHSP
jgi:hypothetical protein